MKHDYSEQFNKPRINLGELLIWLVTGLIILVVLSIAFSIDGKVCSDVIGGQCV